MSQILAFHATPDYSTQAAINAELASLHAANPISVLHTHDNSQGAQWARQWATANGIPSVSWDNWLDGAGYVEMNERHAVWLAKSNPDQVLTAGTTASAVSVQAKAAAKPVVKAVTITKI